MQSRKIIIPIIIITIAVLALYWPIHQVVAQNLGSNKNSQEHIIPLTGALSRENAFNPSARADEDYSVNNLAPTPYTPDSYIKPIYDPFQSDAPEGVIEEFIPAESGNPNDTAPKADFTVGTDSRGIASKNSGTINSTFIFNASKSTDGEDYTSKLKARWDFDGDNTYDTHFSRTKTARHKYERPGTYNVKLQILDTAGNTSIATQQVIVVNNTAPQAFFSYKPQNAGAYSAGASPSYSRASSAGASPSYSRASSAGASPSYSRASSAMTSPTAASPTASPTASSTASPTASSTAQGTPGTIFLFDTSGSSHSQYNDNFLEYRFDWNGDGKWDTTYQSKKSWRHKFETPGVFNVTMEVKDPEGATGTFSRLITVNQNTPPIADFSIETREQVANGSVLRTYVFNASASADLETPKSRLQYRWDFNYTGPDDISFNLDWSNSHIYTGTYNNPGQKVIRLQVRDEDGAVSEVFKSVYVSG